VFSLWRPGSFPFPKGRTFWSSGPLKTDVRNPKQTFSVSIYRGKRYEGVSKSFRTGHLERELQMVHLSAGRCSCMAIFWVSLVSFASITLRITSQRGIPKVSVYFVIDSVRKLLVTPSYTWTTLPVGVGGQLRNGSGAKNRSWIGITISVVRPMYGFWQANQSTVPESVFCKSVWWDQKPLFQISIK
jgi:hypothetical protein